MLTLSESVSGEMRLTLTAGAAMLLDMLFFAILMPLLPELVAEHDLSEAGAGLLTGAYSLGVMAGSLPGALLAIRFGPRTVFLAGLVLVALASLAFAMAASIEILDLARFLQGAGGAWTWGGAMTWLLLGIESGRAGRRIGLSLSIGVSGTVLGPLAGGLASATSIEFVFVGVVVVAALLALSVRGLPAPKTAGSGGLVELRRALGSKGVVTATAIIAIAPIGLGLIGVLMPLRLDALGFGAGFVSLVFTAAAIAQASANAVVGRKSDSVGYVKVLGIGLGFGSVVAMLCALKLPGLVSVPLIVVAVASFGCLNVPAIGGLNEIISAVGSHPAITLAFINLTWALGHAAGSVGGGAIASGIGPEIPFIVLAGVALLGIGGSRRIDTKFVD